MSSMTDIVFLLLIFFLVTSTLINPNALKLLLPKSDSQVSAKPMVVVSIKHHKEEGTYSYYVSPDTQNPVAKPELDDILTSRLEKDETFSNLTHALY